MHGSVTSLRAVALAPSTGTTACALLACVLRTCGHLHLHTCMHCTAACVGVAGLLPGLACRYARDKGRLGDPLEAIKFLCKDFWQALFKKQVDNLKTNHRVSETLWSAWGLPGPMYPVPDGPSIQLQLLARPSVAGP